LTKVKIGFAVVLGTALLFGGGSVLTYPTVAGEPGGTRNDPVAQVQRERAASENEAKLKALLAQKEKEFLELRDRLTALEEAFRDKENRLEKALKEQFQQAARALEAENVAQERADAERRARLAADSGRANPPAEGTFWINKPADLARAGEDERNRALRATQVEQAKDEVEVLEAKLEVKKAQLKAATVSLDAARRFAAHASGDPKTPIELAALSGQVDVKSAELKESDVLLQQAKRRLQKLQGPAKPSRDPNVQQLDQRATELEKKLDALNKELERLRKEFKQQPPR
jgi:hypothetical protein